MFYIKIGDEEESAESLSVTTHTEGLAAINVALRYVKQQADANPTDTRNGTTLLLKTKI